MLEVEGLIFNLKSMVRMKSKFALLKKKKKKKKKIVLTIQIRHLNFRSEVRLISNSRSRIRDLRASTTEELRGTLLQTTVSSSGQAASVFSLSPQFIGSSFTSTEVDVEDGVGGFVDRLIPSGLE